MKVDNAEPVRRTRSADEVLASVRGKDVANDQPRPRSGAADNGASRRSRREAVTVSSRMAQLLDEARWLIMGCGALFLMMVLATYAKTDPSWSHASTATQIHNWGGKVGAWLADMILYLFGASAWLWCLPLAKGLYRGYRAFALKFMVKVKPRDDYEPEPVHRLDRVLGVLGFVMVVFGAVGLEFVRLYSHKLPLPHVPGGILGELFGGAAQVQFGFNGSTMLFLLLITMGLSFYYRFSWLSAAEHTGALIERGVSYIDGLYGSISDRRATQDMAAEPDAVVIKGQADVAVCEPASRIEPRLGTFVDRPGAAPEDREASMVSTVAPVCAAKRGEAGSWRQESANATVRDDSRAARVLEVPERAAALSDEPAIVEAETLASKAAVASSPVAKHAMVIVPAEKPGKPKTPVRMGESELPPLDLLDDPPATQETLSNDTLEFTSRMIEKKLSDFGVEAAVVAAYPGPVITRYEIEPAVGVKGSQIVNLARDLARAFAVTSIRVVETIPGKNYMGLELPNPKRQIVRLNEIIGSQVYHDSASKLTVALGKDSSGKPMVADLAKMPHLLVAGTTGAGKSVGINATILSLLYKADPNEVRLILIDPKMLEMSIYEGIPHLLAPVVTDMRQAGHALNWAVEEMERRYKLMSKMGVRNLAGFNQKIDEAAAKEEKIPNPFSLTPEDPEPLDKLPMIVIIIDELADLMMVVGKKVEELIARIAQKARAAGIHLILATQRPSVDVITGLIKANVPTRIAFQVSSKVDSRTILDQMGAETLLGMGDMLYMPPGTGLPVRVHGAFVSDDEVHRVVEHLKAQGEPNYIEGILEGGTTDEGGGGASGTEGDGEDDPMYDQAVAVVLESKRASISLVQRNLRIGYNRAARLLEQMERSGLVSPMKSNGNRDILGQGGQG